MIKLKCPKCENEWEYKGDSYWPTCTKCQSKFKISDREVEDGRETQEN